MLKGIPDIIGSDLLKALADTGHGDTIVIADHFYPPVTKAPHAVSIQAKGTNTAQMLDAILKLVPLDTQFEKYPVVYMVPDADSGVTMESSPAWDGIKKAVVDNGYDESVVGTIERMKFYEKAASAYVTICTSERLPYGCVILQKGVM